MYPAKGDLAMYNVSEPGALLRTVPGLLSYSPTRSLIVHLIGKNQLIIAVMVIGLDKAGGDGSRVADLASRESAVAVAITIVDESAVTGSHSPLIDEFSAAMLRRGIGITQVVLVDRIAEGGRWWRADGCVGSGVLDDPSTSPVAAEAMARGRRIYRSRKDLMEVVAVDESRGEAFAALLRRVAGPVDAARASAALAEAFERLEANEQVGDEVRAVLAASLGDVGVRDHLLAVSATSDIGLALGVWLDIARCTTSGLRVEALSVAAACAYVLNDSGLASVALESARATQPGHSFSELLSRALSVGIRPKALGQMLASLAPSPASG